MKTLHSAILCLVVLLLTAPLLSAQDFSKYRHSIYLGNELDHIAGTYWPKDGRRKDDSWPSSVNSGTYLVAPEHPRDVPPIGQRPTDSLLFLQWRRSEEHTSELQSPIDISY